MLQQTQVSAVQTAFKKWMQDFPTVQVLASASEESVLLHWQGLGYYSRARNIHKTAKQILQNGGSFPENRKDLESLPGIGAYTAGAILSLAFHQPEAILDGNLVRIFSRLCEWNFLPTKDKNSKDAYWAEAYKWAQAGSPFLTNEALMELGRTVCKKTNPLCKNCPIQKICNAFKNNRAAEFPPKKETKYVSWIGFAIAICDSEGNYLLQSSPKSPFLKNQLTFPLFEYADAFKNVFPGIAENIISFENVKRFAFTGIVEHSITRYKIRCSVLCVEAKNRKGLTGTWIPKQELPKKIISSFAQKIVILTHDF
ncbi:MAG: A/G-specific adenine glycosylase [Fibrobacter sp.]|nr:A/G-specific adenine glycosylase [Fibrobacter sp.]